MNSYRGNNRAFTLLEMLVATAMISVLAGSFYATLRIAFRAQRSALRTIEPVRKAKLAVDLLRADIQSALVPKGVLAGSFLGEDAIDASGRDYDSLLLHCTNRGPGETEATGDVRMVELYCQPADDGTGLSLVRRITSNLLAPRVEEPPEEVLCRGLWSFNLRYFDGSDWQDSWDSGAQDNVLPLAVEVTIQLQSDQKDEQDIAGYRTSEVFLVPCSSLMPGAAQ